MQKNLNTILIICTIPNCSKTHPSSIAKTLITKKLAACVTLIPYAYSVYCWDNNIQQEKETQLLIKTCVKLEKSVFEYIKAIHPYRTPELLTFTITHGESNYLSWIHDTLN